MASDTTETVAETPRQAARRLAAAALRDGFLPQALHAYTDAAGNAIYFRIRLKHPDFAHAPPAIRARYGQDKWIRPMRSNGAGFVLGEPAFAEGKPLYRLHELMTRPETMVWLVEGERCADALAERGLLATTSGGADSAAQADWRPLAGRRITIWPDHDAAGQRYAETVRDTLLGLDCSVRLLDVARLDLPAAGDAVDWLQAHPLTTLSEIEALPAMAEPQEASAAGQPVTAPDRFASSGSIRADPPRPLPAPRSETDHAVLARLGALGRLQYDRVRLTEAKALGVRPATLDALVRAARREDPAAGIALEDIEPWPQAVEPAALLGEIAATVRRFVVCSAHTAHAAALWVAMTWFIDVVAVAPLAVITSPEKRCGKSQLLALLGRLAYRPLTASNISPAALFRAIDAWRPTLLVDEADAFMRENEELRGLLNCGHTREAAYVVRVVEVGATLRPQRFSTWGAKALAGIGRLADTLMDRALVLELRRKLAGEPIERLRHAEPELFQTLAAKLACFAHEAREAVGAARPELPESLDDRAQDNWEPLLAIAEVAGAAWPALARAAAVQLSAERAPARSLGTELLADIREVFDTQGIERISSAALIAALTADELKPWASVQRGQPLTQRQLAQRLEAYRVASKNLKLGPGVVNKGYERAQFADAFARYLGAPPENPRYPLPAGQQAAGGVAQPLADPLPAATRYPGADSAAR